MGPRDALILRAGHTHFGVQSNKDDPPVYYWAHFVTEELSTNDTIKVPQYLNCANFDIMCTLFHQLISEQHSAKKIQLSADYILSLLLINLTRNDSNGLLKDTLTAKSLYSRVQEYIRINYENDISLSLLSEIFHYSNDYISRIFKQYAGESINNYLHTVRLAHAKQLLLSTTDTVKEIAYQCGYTNEKFFSTIFLKYVGTTPTKFRNVFGDLHQNDR